ncbi:MAG: outer membrane protein assembly factor BamD [Thalassobaculales bacterium]
MRLAGCFLIAALALAACSSSSKDEAYVERPVEELYNRAMDTALARQFRSAAPMFDEVERQHPYSVWATKAQLMAAYSRYQSNQYDEALQGLDRFIELNPSHPDVAYAHYLRALSWYEQIIDVGRDQEVTQNALRYLEEVTRRFPDTTYARDARLKIDLTRNHLAGKEMEIGRFYQKRGHFAAAINRFQKVIDNFQTTDQVPEALHRLTECYLALGLRDQAAKTAAVLGHNFPGSDWYQDSYALLEGGPGSQQGESPGWFRRTITSLF